MEFFRIKKDIPFMRHALVFNVISFVTFLAAVFFLHRDAHQALFGHQLRDVPGVCLLVGALDRAVTQVALGKPAHGVAELFLLGGEFEIHDLKSAVEGRRF